MHVNASWVAYDFADTKEKVTIELSVLYQFYSRSHTEKSL